MTQAVNVYGEPLDSCSEQPMTGYLRDGCCSSDATDPGRHLVCARMTPAFLAYSRSRGNDLVTPRPEFGFPGLNPGDRWCLCAARWFEAFRAGVAPPVNLGATHQDALELIPLEALKQHALDLV